MELYGTMCYVMFGCVKKTERERDRERERERERERVRQPLSGVRRQKTNDILTEEKSMTPLFET